MRRMWFAKTSWVVLVSVLVALLAAAACGGDATPKPAAVDTDALSTLVQEAVAAASSDAVSAEALQALVDDAVMKATEASGEALSADDIAGIVASALAEQEAAAARAKLRPIKWSRQDADSWNLIRTLTQKIVVEELGYEVEDVSPGGTSPMWLSVANGDIDVSVEIWTGNPTSFAHYEDLVLDKKQIEKVTELGYTGHNKIAVPTYVIEGDADRGIEAAAPDLKTWADLDKYKDVFSIVETAPKGRFLGAVVTWGGWDDRFAGYGVDYEVQFAGSEAAMIAELDAAYNKGEPIFFYGYTPHWIWGKYDLTEIEQPAWTEECHRAPADGPCGQPIQNLFTIVHAGFGNEFPEVYQFLKNVNNFTDADMGGMMLAVNAGSSYDEAVQRWMDRNQEKWQAWIP